MNSAKLSYKLEVTLKGMELIDQPRGINLLLPTCSISENREKGSSSRAALRKKKPKSALLSLIMYKSGNH